MHFYKSKSTLGSLKVFLTYLRVNRRWVPLKQGQRRQIFHVFLSKILVCLCNCYKNVWVKNKDTILFANI